MAITLPAEEYIHETQPDGRVVTYCTMRQIVLHTIGLNDSRSHRHRPYHRHGKCYYKRCCTLRSTRRPAKSWSSTGRYTATASAMPVRMLCLHHRLTGRSIRIAHRSTDLRRCRRTCINDTL